jgi:hypothetical protein
MAAWAGLDMAAWAGLDMAGTAESERGALGETEAVVTDDNWDADVVSAFRVRHW